jgi:hypothetical protein
MSMLPTHFDSAVKLDPYCIITSIGLIVGMLTLVGINFVMMEYKMEK